MKLNHCYVIAISLLLPMSAAYADNRQAASDAAPASMRTAQADYMPSLITATPLEGRQLAITIVRKTIGEIQRDGDAKRRVRAVYEEDPMMLMRAVELINREFAIIAEANNWWRDRVQP